MAIQASGRRTPSGNEVYKVLWHIYEFVKNLAYKHVTVVDKSVGSDWDKADDSGMADGAWLVLEGKFAVNDKYWQCFIGGRNSAGQLAGFNATGQTNITGLWASFAWENAWDSTNKTWQAGKLALYDTNGVPMLMALNGISGGTFTLVPQIEMAVVERINPETAAVIDSAFIFICTDGGSNQNWYNGLYAGAYHPASPNNLAPRVFFAGRPGATGNTDWAASSPRYGRCLDKTASTVADALIEANNTRAAGTLITDEDSGYYGEEVLFWNYTAGTKVKGRLIAVHLIDQQAGQGEKMGGGYWIATSRLAFPSKP